MFKVRFLLMTIAGLAWGVMGGEALLGAPIPEKGSLSASTLYLEPGFVDTLVEENLLSSKPTAFDGEKHYVIQLDGPMTPGRRDVLASVGVDLGKYLPLNAYLVKLGECDPRQLAEVGFVQWVGAFRDGWKIAPALSFSGPVALEQQPTEGGQTARFDRQTVPVIIVLFPGEDLEEAKGGLADIANVAIGGETVVTGDSIGGEQWLIEARVSPEALQPVSAVPQVQYIEPAPEPTLRNDTTHWILQSNVLDFDPIWDRGLHGEGMIGQIIDSILDEEHCAFTDDVEIGPDHRKIVAYHGSTSSNPHMHGTHTSGTMVGKQIGGDSLDGMAYEARMVYTYIGLISIGSSTNLNAAFVTAYDEGARVHSNSWGADYRTDYNNWSMQIDLFTYEHEESMVAFAVTNQSTLYTPENAKNVLAVGASRDTPLQDSHCYGGAGPTADGRRKPEVYAPGCNAFSSIPGTCSYGVSGGTSMACPAVSGMGLLVRQYFIEGLYPTGVPTRTDGLTPSGALMRAVLINSAVDMTSVPGYPGNREGWGRVLLDNALYFEGDTGKLIASDVWNAEGLSTGEFTGRYVQVSGDGRPLKVTLVWSDPPAAVGTAFAPINNLDLRVLSPSGIEYLGNVFSSGESAPGGTADDRNNVEQVHITVPETGLYTMTVDAPAVNEGIQGYALVITGDVVPEGSNRAGDFDQDGDVDLDDFAELATCLTGPWQAPGFVIPSSECRLAFDLDADSDVDLPDFAGFQIAFGPQE